MDEKQPTLDTAPVAERPASGVDPIALIVAAICAAGWIILFVMTCFHS